MYEVIELLCRMTTCGLGAFWGNYLFSKYKNGWKAHVDVLTETLEAQLVILKEMHERIEKLEKRK